MTNKEILAELKRSYEYLRDIRESGCADHCNGQMENNIDKLDSILENIEDIYYDFYRTLDKEDLKVKKDIYIADSVDYDYIMAKEEILYITCCDLNYYWYEDEDFIRE